MARTDNVPNWKAGFDLKLAVEGGGAHSHRRRDFAIGDTAEVLVFRGTGYRAVGLARCRDWINVAMAAVVMFAALTVSAATCPVGVGSPPPTTDFSVNGDSTVVHIVTGLMWKRCTEGLSGSTCDSGAATHLKWSDALSLARNSNFAGYTDWRLPNKREMESLVDDHCYGPAINDAAFPRTPGDCAWTSTTLVADPAMAWCVAFDQGDTRHIDKFYVGAAVRLVRGGQTFDAQPAGPPILNIDDSDAATQYAAATDGVLLVRYLFGLRGASLTASALGANPQRSDTEIEAHIAANLAAFDVDGDGRVLAATDGLLILRRLLGLSGPGLTAGAKNSLGSDADVAAFIDALKP